MKLYLADLTLPVFAQDTRTVAEPVIPPTYTTLCTHLRTDGKSSMSDSTIKDTSGSGSAECCAEKFVAFPQE